jgi:tRNA(fMet)-specific endonuclease VapC
MNDPNRVLLDSNVVIGLFGGEPLIVERIDACAEVFLPVIVLGELYYGAMRSTRRSNNVARLEEFARRVAVLPCMPETARTYGRIKAALSGKGRPIPENDVWIAAFALQHDLTVLTKDNHFTEIEGLSLNLLD